MKSWLAVLAGAAALSTGAAAHAALFVSTDQSGAQVQDDINHTQHWTYSVSAEVPAVDGALFVMKRGPHTSENTTFVIIQGTYADFGSVTPIFSKTLTPADFTQSYDPISFQDTSVPLHVNTVYTGVLYSSAADAQDEAYFIKQGNLVFVDGAGDPVNTVEVLPPSAIPEPASLAVLGLGVLGVVARRRR
jgi:hypothetical protein